MEYLENLLTCEEPTEKFLWPQMKDNEEVCPPPTLQEVEWQNNKSSELDGIQSVILKALNRKTVVSIHKPIEFEKKLCLIRRF